MKKNVLLIAPYRKKETTDDVNREDFMPSQALISLAAFLRESGFEPIMLDLNNCAVHREPDSVQYCKNKILDTITEHNPKIIGINCLFSGLFSIVLEYVEFIKEKHPNIKIIMGGIHATTYPKQILKNTLIDYIATGEGEEQIAEISKMIYENNYNGIDEIKSFAYLDESGEPKINDITNRLNYDELPSPAWDLVNYDDFEMNLDHYNNPKNQLINTIIPVVSERGCPFKCNFCDLYVIQGRGLRRRSAEKFVDELELLNKEYGQNYFSFMDDNLTADRRHILGICDEILKRKLNIQFGTVGGLHVNSLDEEIIGKMVEAGMVDALLAPEHGNDYMRNTIIKKKLDREKIYEIAEIIRQYKVNLGGNWIMGFPEETDETLTDMLDMIDDLKLDRNSVGVAIPFPQTELFDQCVRDDLFVDTIDFNLLWKTPIWAFKHLNSDSVGGEFFIKPYKMELHELNEWRKKFVDAKYKYFGHYHKEFKHPKRFWSIDGDQLK